MKKDYSGLEAVKITFGESNKIITESVCVKIYVTHHDADLDNLCDEPQYFNEDPGHSEGVTWTELWSDFPSTP